MIESSDRRRVLLLEDHPAVRELVRVMLEHEGSYSVCVSSTAREALYAIDTDQPDIAVLDLSVPDMDGVDVVKGVRRQCPGARIVVFSGDDRRQAEALASGADAFVLKGGSRDDLLRAIRGDVPTPATAHNPGTAAEAATGSDGTPDDG